MLAAATGPGVAAACVAAVPPVAMAGVDVAVATTAGGTTTVLGGAASGAWVATRAAGARLSPGPARMRVTAMEPSAPIAAAATIQAARGRSRTTITVGSFGRSLKLTGATEPALLSAAAIDEATSEA